jgi:hypothetical protein
MRARKGSSGSIHEPVTTELRGSRFISPRDNFPLNRGLTVVTYMVMISLPTVLLRWPKSNRVRHRPCGGSKLTVALQHIQKLLTARDLIVPSIPLQS